MVVLLLAQTFCPNVKAQEAGKGRWWPNSIESILTQSGTNKAELVAALEKTPADQRAGMKFLVENMPQGDLDSLSSAFLLENVALSYESRKFPWAKSIREEMFLNDVLPYASVNEQRDNWRRIARDLCLPWIKDCKSPV